MKKVQMDPAFIGYGYIQVFYFFFLSFDNLTVSGNLLIFPIFSNLLTKKL